MRRKGWLGLGLLLGLGGCAGIDTSGDTVQNLAVAGLANYIVAPNGSELMGAAIAYLVYDPLAPNWEIEETRISEDTFAMQLRMKRYHTGGEGEAIMVLKRRAAQLQREMGYAGYRILDYQEGIDSQTMAARRFGEGTIRLVRR